MRRAVAIRTVTALLSLGLAALTISGAAAAEEPAAGPAPAGDPRAVVGAPRGRPLAGAELEARTKHVASLLRCPVCQGLSVADSPSTTAQKMKGQVREMVAAGYEQDQILAYFETSYGAFVRLEPPLRGVNWLVWLAPILGLAAGGGIVAWALRAPGRGERRLPDSGGAAEGRSDDPGPLADVADASDPAPGPDTLPDDSRLAAYVLRVREAVYGWPGGRSPAPVKPNPDPAQAPPGAANQS